MYRFVLVHHFEDATMWDICIKHCCLGNCLTFISFLFCNFSLSWLNLLVFFLCGSASIQTFIVTPRRCTFYMVNGDRLWLHWSIRCFCFCFGLFVYKRLTVVSCRLYKLDMFGLVIRFEINKTETLAKYLKQHTNLHVPKTI